MNDEAYTKLFHTLPTSSVWMECYATRIVWITLLVMSNKDGIVRVTAPGLAKVAGVTMDEATTALEVFSSPDPHSRDKGEDGRRILPVDGGWQLINHGVYMEKASTLDKQGKWRRQKKRQRVETDGTGVDMERTELDKKEMSAMSTHVDVDVDVDVDKETKRELLGGNRNFKVTRDEWNAYSETIKLDLSDADASWDFYTSKGWKVGTAMMRDWQAAMRNWQRNTGNFSKGKKPESKETQQNIKTKKF
jgi:hypothetical protein